MKGNLGRWSANLGVVGFSLPFLAYGFLSLEGEGDWALRVVGLTGLSVFVTGALMAVPFRESRIWQLAIWDRRVVVFFLATYVGAAFFELGLSGLEVISAVMFGMLAWVRGVLVWRRVSGGSR